MKSFCENSYFHKNAPSWMFNLVPNTGPSNTTKKELYLEHLFLELLCYIFRFQFRKVLVLEKKLVSKFVLESLLNKVSGLQSVKKNYGSGVFLWVLRKIRDPHYIFCSIAKRCEKNWIQIFFQGSSLHFVSTVKRTMVN